MRHTPPSCLKLCGKRSDDLLIARMPDLLIAISRRWSVQPTGNRRLKRVEMLVDRRVHTGQRLTFLVGRAVERIAGATQRVEQHSLQVSPQHGVDRPADGSTPSEPRAWISRTANAETDRVTGAAAARPMISSNDRGEDRGKPRTSIPCAISTSRAARRRSPLAARPLSLDRTVSARADRSSSRAASRSIRSAPALQCHTEASPCRAGRAATRHSRQAGGHQRDAAAITTAASHATRITVIAGASPSRGGRTRTSPY